MGGKKMFFGGSEKKVNLSDFTYYNNSIILPTSVQGFCFNSDYTKIWVIYPTATNTIRQYSLSVAGDITTMIFESSFNANIVGGRGILANPNDSQIYVWDINYGMRVYDLSTANDITTAVLSASNYYLLANPRYGFDISPDGKNIILSESNNGVEKYTMATPYDFTSMIFNHYLGSVTTLRSTSYVNKGHAFLMSSSLSGSQNISQHSMNPQYIGSYIPQNNVLIDSLDLSASYGTGGVFSAQYNKENTSLFFLRGDRKIYQFNL